MRGSWPRAIAKLAVVLFVLLSAHSVCDAYFDCGCETPWHGGVEHCDAMVAGPPDCPWCTGGPPRLAWVGGLIFGGVALGFRAARARPVAFVVLGGLLGYAAGSAVASLAAALLTDYPRWLGLAL